MSFLTRIKIKDLHLVIGLTILTVAVELLGPDMPLIRLIPGLALALFLPGYALTRAIAPQRPFTKGELIFNSLGLSIIAVILSGLLLNLSSAGLNAVSWSIWLGGLTLAASIYALSIAPKEAETPKPRTGLGFNLWQYIVLLGAIALVVGGFYYSAQAAPQPGQAVAEFNQFWLVPAATKETGEAQAVIGITNYQGQAQTYNITLQLNGTKIGSWDHVTLQQGETWKNMVAVPKATSNNPNQPRLLEADLSLSSKPDQVIRTVNLQV